MLVVDANVLLYAINVDSPQHHRARRWLGAALNGPEAVGFSWQTILAFLRLSTKQLVSPRPLTVAQATSLLEEWLELGAAEIVVARTGHLRRLTDVLEAGGTAGNLVHDAELAALAIEHHATVISFDRDFARFPGLRWRQPE